MPLSPQNFVLLRDQQRWPRASLAGLEIDPDGALMLARIPGVAAGSVVDVPGPYDPPMAAFAVSPCGEAILASAAERKILLVDTRCPDHRWLLDIDGDCDADPSVSSLTACAAGQGRLYLADRESAAVHLFSLPRLEGLARWHGGFAAPARIAVDAAARVYVLDAGRMCIVRLTGNGRIDATYQTGEIAALAQTVDLAVTADGSAFVSVKDDGRILQISPQGKSLAAIDPPGATGLRPGALAVDAAHLYVGDRATGSLWVHARSSGHWLAPVPAFRAPIVALAVDDAGHLCVRTTVDICLDTMRLDARAGRIGRGLLEAGPFDAGVGIEWMRAHVDAVVPAGCRVRLEAALEVMPATGVMPAAPAPSSWRTLPAPDALVHTPGPSDRPSDPAARVLFLRVQVESDAVDRSPSLRQITAETEGDDYLGRLPAVYAREDAAEGFLRSWLEAFRAEAADRGLDITDLARRLDPATAPPDYLPWLASWLAYDLPVRPDEERDSWRELLLDAHRLYARRGTVAGLREMVRLYAGVECEIVETFRARRLWLLDADDRAGLGFDTGLLPALPDGMAVPGPTLPDDARQGLSVAYFIDSGLRSRAYGLAADRDPDGSFPSLAGIIPLDEFAAVWTGQIRSRFSELYTFYLSHTGGVRLFVDDQLLIDRWTSESDREPRGYLPLTADRWYPIRIEYWARSGGQRLRLSWSSASQPRTVVPGEALYAVSNDNVDPAGYRHDAGRDHLVVGEAVVGAHGPLVAEDFGSALFDEDAHHFTVTVRARDLCTPHGLARVRAVLDAEKPAHSEYHLCIVEPQFRIGVQARVGVDAVVSALPPAGRYDEGRLGVNARLGLGAGHDDGRLRVEENLRLGSGARLR